MNETCRETNSQLKNRFRNFAGWYAFSAPTICAVLSAVLLFSVGASPVIYNCAAGIFVSSLIMGVVSLFGNSLPGVMRGLVLVGMLVSGVLGGLAILLSWVGVVAHGLR